MFYYINQPRTPTFPTGLVKTESDFIVRSVETGLRRWMLVVAVISVDSYPFFGFLRTELSPWGYGNRCFVVALCHLIVRRQLGSSDQEASPSAGKNTRVDLVPCCAWKCVPTAISGSVDISEFPGYHLLWQMTSQWGSQKLLQGLVFHELTTYLSVFKLF